MSDLDTRLRTTAANQRARELGYRIAVDQLSTHPVMFRAYAHQLKDEPSLGRFLCNRPSSLEALEDGASVLHGIVRDGKPWPDGAD